MAIMVRHEAKALADRKRHGRAVNAVAELLRKRLSVPHIYLEPSSSLIKADVLAVDRAGSGDLHAVEVKFPYFSIHKADNTSASRGATSIPATKLRQALDQIRSQPAHLKYLAMQQGAVHLVKSLDLFSPDGIGRIGIIAITEHDDHPPVAELVSIPERFRVSADQLQVIEKKLLAKTHPDIEVRI